MNASEFAKSVNSDGKKVRKFLREVTPKESRPGRGHEWRLPDNSREVTKLKRRFQQWASVHTR